MEDPRGHDLAHLFFQHSPVQHSFLGSYHHHQPWGIIFSALHFDWNHVFGLDQPYMSPPHCITSISPVLLVFSMVYWTLAALTSFIGYMAQLLCFLWKIYCQVTMQLVINRDWGCSSWYGGEPSTIWCKPMSIQLIDVLLTYVVHAYLSVSKYD